MAEGRGEPGRTLAALARAIPRCRRCPELRAYCSRVAAEKRRAFRQWRYWGRPVPGFGDERATIVIVGLAPAAHGANRTGRMFTGDRSGDFLYAGLHRTGLANQAQSTHRGDGLELGGVFITAALRCAPPGNRPTAKQAANCRGYLVRELRVLRPAVVVALGQIAWKAALTALSEAGAELPRPRPRFAHGAELPLGKITLLGCNPSASRTRSPAVSRRRCLRRFFDAPGRSGKADRASGRPLLRAGRAQKESGPRDAARVVAF